MNFQTLQQKIQRILAVELPPGKSVVNPARTLAGDIRVGRTSFMRKMGVSSELEYKLQSLKDNRIMFHAHIGMGSWEATAERLVLTELTATFNLDVLSPSPSIRVSFGDEGPDLLSEGVLLDGRPIPFELQEGTLVFQAPEPGPHRLDLSLRPDTQTGETNSGFDLAIPRLATSRLDLMIPPDAPDIDVRSAVGSLYWDYVN